MSPVASQTGAAFALFSILLMPFTIAGLALINTGLVRSRNAAHVMMSSLCIVSVAAAAYFVCGFAFQGFEFLLLSGIAADLNLVVKQFID